MTNPTPPDPDLERVTQEIARQLNETHEAPMRQIRLLVKQMGAEFARALLKETLTIEASGGMLTADRTRRRTPGGVFFFLAKGKLPPEAREVVFPLPDQAKKVPALAWEERLPLLQQAVEAAESGRYGALSALPRTTLIGRPEAIHKSEHTVAFELRYELPESLTFPRGIPKPPSGFTLRYLVLAGSQQYQRVERELRQKPDEQLIVEGICTHDPALNALVVLAVIVTTRGNQKRAKEGVRQPMLSVEEDDALIALPGHPIPHPDFKREKKLRQLQRQMKAKPDKHPLPSAAKPAVHPEAAPAPQPITEAAAPAGADTLRAKLRDLEQTAHTLRERMATMEAKKQPGVAMTKKLLENTERQIEALRRALSS